MTPLWFAETFVSSIIAAATFIGIGAIWAWWKVLPLWRRHGPAIKAMLEERER